MKLLFGLIIGVIIGLNIPYIMKNWEATQVILPVSCIASLKEAGDQISYVRSLADEFPFYMNGNGVNFICKGRYYNLHWYYMLDERKEAFRLRAKETFAKGAQKDEKILPCQSVVPSKIKEFTTVAESAKASFTVSINASVNFFCRDLVYPNEDKDEIFYMKIRLTERKDLRS